jgi:hypothetical protein
MNRTDYRCTLQWLHRAPIPCRWSLIFISLAFISYSSHSIHPRDPSYVVISSTRTLCIALSQVRAELPESGAVVWRGWLGHGSFQSIPQMLNTREGVHWHSSLRATGATSAMSATIWQDPAAPIAMLNTTQCKYTNRFPC